MTALNDNLLYTNDQKNKRKKNNKLRYQRRQKLKKNIYL